MKFVSPVGRRLGVRLRSLKPRMYYSEVNNTLIKHRITPMVAKATGELYFAEETQRGEEAWQFMRYAARAEYEALPRDKNDIPAIGPLVGEWTLRMARGTIEFTDSL